MSNRAMTLVETKGELIMGSTSVQRVDRTDKGVQFISYEEREGRKDNDFKGLIIEQYSPWHLGFLFREVKNGRMYERSISVSKEPLEKLIEELIAIKDKMETRAPK